MTGSLRLLGLLGFIGFIRFIRFVGAWEMRETRAETEGERNGERRVVWKVEGAGMGCGYVRMSDQV